MLESYYKIFHCFGITHEPTCILNPLAFFFLKFRLSSLAIYFFQHFPELYQILNIFGYPKTSP